MSRPTLTVKQAGPLALIQDAGRFGVGHLGVTQGGAADWIAFRWANWLLGNSLCRLGCPARLVHPARPGRRGTRVGPFSAGERPAFGPLAS